MIAVRTKTAFYVKEILAAVQEASRDPLERAAQNVARDAIASIKHEPDIRVKGPSRGKNRVPTPPGYRRRRIAKGGFKTDDGRYQAVGGKVSYFRKSSPRGSPPFTHVQHRRGLRDMIKWAVDPKTNSGLAGLGRGAGPMKYHEWGGRRRPRRPFMRPAMTKERGRFAGLFRNLKLARTRSGRALNARRFKR
uniref:Tail protein n=1 Tax=viral metagenome TaxID=1070528 RepID=A0A6H2A502_9ZZZZ